MAVINEQMLKKDLASNCLASTYFIFGNDGYLLHSYYEKLVNAVTSTDDVFNFAKFTSSASLQELYDFRMQIPMLSDKKCAVLYDFDFEKCDKSDFEKLLSLCSEDIDSCLLLIVCDTFTFDVKKSDRAKKIISALEKGNGKAVEINHRTVPELVKAVVSAVKKRGCVISSSDAEYLIQTVSDDLNIIVSEVEKLCAYVNNGTLTRDIIDKTAVRSVEESVYNLSAEILKGDVENAVKMLDSLYFMRVEPMAIFSVISSVYVDMARLLFSQISLQNTVSVATDFKYGNRAFVLDKAKRNLKNFDEKKLSLSLNVLTKTDFALKSSSYDSRILLEELIVKLVYIAKKGECIDIS